ncbi:retinol dehydrogenase 13 [Cryphonectria parasitica EP155]|uniref:Retinol dehydrogenase 13 n=1 Tax=Cryphonectria parasitica (strain ATCC 38755 / EP155) TaxID=660469 RepID=A0A9P4XTQ1_CRYP1|nr:retinol dehydrogenase 13 [Cryphonectria parasitica EP155]KAF3761062.1 retinol dehydrogenase 13 [Cryphonectria parasitica EP155]
MASERPAFNAAPYDATTTATELAEKYSSQIRDKIVLVVGASLTSIGGTFAVSIASAQPRLLILAGRSLEKTQQTADAITTAETRVLQVDLSSLASVREAASALLAYEDVPRVDVVMLNAGIMGTEYAVSPDGFESQLATNHLGPFLFTNLIMPKILKSEAPRIVPVSSNGHRLGGIRWGDYNFSNGETYDRWRAYGQSKTANMLFARSLATKLGEKHGLQAYSLCPGLVGGTLLGAHLDPAVDYAEMTAVDQALGNIEGWVLFSGRFTFKSIECGASTLVFAAFSPDLKHSNGGFVHDCQLADLATSDYVKVWARDDIEAERLWKLTERLVGQEFVY